MNKEIHATNYSFISDEFIVNLENDLFYLDQMMQIDENGFCKVCDTGVIIFGVGLDSFIQSNHSDVLYIQTSLKNRNLVVKNDAIDVRITTCPVGYGADENEYQCHLCADGTYNLLPNNTDECKDCHEERNKGVNCYGGSVYVKKGHWLGFQNSNYDDMITSLCPSLYCCNHDPFCKYNINESSQSTLCAQGRNLDVPLCGACVPGATEAINSPQCVMCNGYHYIWLLQPMLLAILYTLYLVMCHPKDTNTNTNTKQNKSHAIDLVKQKTAWTEGQSKKCCCCYFSRVNEQYLLLLSKTLIARNILYYEQALGSILYPSVVTPFMAYIYSVASLFSLETNIPNTHGEPICGLPGLTAKKKIILGLLPWAIIFALLAIIFPLHYAYSHFVMKKQYEIRWFNTNYSKAFLSFLIISVSQILAVCFKLLNCQKVGSVRVHFYFGEEICFETFTMAIGIIVIVFVAMIFCALWVALRKENSDERKDSNYALNQLCKYYSPECYYWEFVLLMRRSIITLFGILYTWHWFPIILIALLLIFLGLHHKYQPFIIKEANVAEYFALCSLIVVISIHITLTHSELIINTAAIILSLFIIIPVIVTIIYIIIQIYKDIKQNSTSNPNSMSSLPVRRESEISKEKKPLKSHHEQMEQIEEKEKENEFDEKNIATNNVINNGNKNNTNIELQLVTNNKNNNTLSAPLSVINYLKKQTMSMDSIKNAELNSMYISRSDSHDVDSNTDTEDDVTDTTALNAKST